MAAKTIFVTSLKYANLFAIFHQEMCMWNLRKIYGGGGVMGEGGVTHFNRRLEKQNLGSNSLYAFQY